MILGIYGAGGLGRETLMLAQLINEKEKRWEDILFIDDINPERVLKNISVKSFAQVKNIKFLEVVIAIGEPAIRASMAEKIRGSRINLATLIDPSAYISPCSKIGDGVVIYQGVNVSCDTCVEDNVIMQAFSSISHDCHIAAHSITSTYSAMAGAVYVGTRTFIGMGALIKEKIRIGNDVIVGMGANVVSSVPDKMVVLGNPAKIVRENDSGRVFR
ncbi:acetyltransferase [Pectobacterium brasiliense]|uniref:acetyltransferase n=1 Tax=Pectobacterium brasiliense TaxID=180957 RepID=UPI000B96B099|nr:MULTISPECIES: acetyltransferase [Pectobacterium]MBN3189598.1 acetyltransferase [Pectobacterium brasiliense]OYN51451.1 hypothetical protein B7L51_10055 [Pectobacterium carotovorum]